MGKRKTLVQGTVVTLDNCYPVKRVGYEYSVSEEIDKWYNNETSPIVEEALKILNFVEKEKRGIKDSEVEEKPLFGYVSKRGYSRYAVAPAIQLALHRHLNLLGNNRKIHFDETKKLTGFFVVETHKRAVTGERSGYWETYDYEYDTRDFYVPELINKKNHTLYEVSPLDTEKYNSYSKTRFLIHSSSIKQIISEDEDYKNMLLLSTMLSKDMTAIEKVEKLSKKQTLLNNDISDVFEEMQ